MPRQLTLETESSGRLDPLGSNRFWGKIEAGRTMIDFLKTCDSPIPRFRRRKRSGRLDLHQTAIWIRSVNSWTRTATSSSEDDYGAVLPNVEDFFMWT